MPARSKKSGCSMKKTCGPPPGPGGVRYSHARSVCPPSGIASAEPVRSSDGVVSRTIWYSGMKTRSEEHTSELQSLAYLVCRLLLEKKKKNKKTRLIPFDNQEKR